MRVLHVVATFSRGGIATSLWHLLPSLNEQPGQEVFGAVFHDKGWFGSLLEDAGVPIQQLNMVGKYDPRVLGELIKTCRGFDIIHAHGWPVILFVAIVSLFVRKPSFILSEHSVTNRRRRPFLKWLDRWIYSRYDHIVAVSKAVAESLEKWQPQLSGKISVVYNGINRSYIETAESKTDLRHRLDLPEEVPVIFASGNFRFAKGFDLLLESISQLIDGCREAGWSDAELPLLVITGDGELQDSMATLSRDLGITDQVRFLGFRTDMPLILKSADVFVLSSRWEGCPMVVLESTSLGVPVVATDVGGVPELIIHNQTGILVPPGDPALLSACLREMLQDTARASCLAEQGQRRFARLFSIENIATSMSKVYSQIVGDDF